MDQPTLAQRVRLHVYEQFLEHGTPPVAEELMSDFSLSRDEVGTVLHELEAARHIALVKGTLRILMAFPFSAIATPFRVHARGRDYFANCAWDAVAFHSMLGEDDVTIDSHCHHCAAPVRVELSGGRATLVEPVQAIVYLALRPTQWWVDIIATCSNTMVFFASAEHRDASDLCAPADQAASLAPDQVHALSRPLYSRRLEMGYARPGRDELMAHFTALGLT
ncbi:MAG: alkylmercury lyase family protein, partial [Chloroflexota bacterium]|nr:alkylmercury lyase family protein [Chloroflexota bacterium]